MPATYSDQFFLIDPYSPPPAGTAMNFSNFNLTDQNDDNDFDSFDNDSIDGSDITSSYPGDTVTINVPGVGNVTYTGVTFYLADGRQVFTPNDGQVLQNGTLVSTTFVNTQGPLLTSQLGPPCFVAGTLITTPDGETRVETLKVGDRVKTMDSGVQPVRWIGCTTVDAQGKFAPIVFPKGSIGNLETLKVSPQHRMLISGWKAELFFGQSEVLVPAKHLVDGQVIVQQASNTVAYYHILFDQHEIIFANGAQCESFYPGDQILLQDRAVYHELSELFPELASPKGRQTQKTARATLRGQDARILASAV